MDDMELKEDEPWEVVYRGQTIKGVTKGAPLADIRAAFQEYFKEK